MASIKQPVERLQEKVVQSKGSPTGKRTSPETFFSFLKTSQANANSSQQKKGEQNNGSENLIEKGEKRAPAKDKTEEVELEVGGEEKEWAKEKS